MKKLAYIALLFGLLSCEKQISFDLSTYDKKLVVNAFLEDGMVFEMFLGESVKTLDVPSLRSNVSLARLILLEDGNIVINEDVEIDSGYLKTNYLIKKGSQYQMFLETDDLPYVSSSDIVPENIPIVKIDDVFLLGEKLHIKLLIDDNVQPENYLLQLYIRGYSISGTDSIWSDKAFNFKSTDKVFLSNINTFISNSNYALFNDNLLGGGKRSLTLTANRKEMFSPGFNPKYVKVKLNSLSDSYFQYYLEILENNHVYGGPLASSSYDAGNIEGGLGIFGAFTSAIDSAVTE